MTWFFYWTGWLIIRFFAWVYTELEVEGAEKMPRKGGVILASNHLNNADPGLVGICFRRRFAFMAKAEMFQWLFLGGYVRLVGAFPVRRFEADLGALRKARQLLRQGLALMMFPEGTRSRTAMLAEGHPGTAMLALQAGVPIVPVAITGSEVVKLPAAFFRPFRRAKVRVVVGEPFTLPEVSRINSEAVRQSTDEIMMRIAALLPESYRGFYRDKVPAESGRRAHEVETV